MGEIYYTGPDKRTCRTVDGAIVDFRDLRKGDRFTMYESDGSPVDDGRVFTVVTDPRPPSLNEYFTGVWSLGVG